eukprot:scaffold823_cov397-Prasinococcus_capsulatus_cf.AAC.2
MAWVTAYLAHRLSARPLHVPQDGQGVSESRVCWGGHLRVRSSPGLSTVCSGVELSTPAATPGGE